jgi:hypothetical protein
VSADTVARTADIAEEGAGHTAAGRRVAGAGVARILAAHRMVAEAAAVARRKLLAVPAGSIGRVEVQRRRVEQEAGLHTAAGGMAHRIAEEGVVARIPGEVEEIVGSIDLGRAVEARRTAGEEVVARSPGEAALTWLANVRTHAPEQRWCDNTHDHKVGTRDKTSRGNALYAA